MDYDPIKILNFFNQASLHYLCDSMPLNYSQLAIYYYMSFHLVKAARGSDPKIMHIEYPLDTPDAVADLIQGFWLRGSIGEFTEAIPEDVKANFYNEERY